MLIVILRRGYLCKYYFVMQVNRLETQVKRYKQETEDSEKLEDELKTEKRKLQREVCCVLVSSYVINLLRFIMQSNFVILN